MAGPSKKKLIEIYRKMFLTMTLDEKINELVAQGISMVQHSTRGQEATPIAACATIRDDDYVMPYHRGWAWAIGKGMEPAKIMAELMGKKTGYCKGKGGPHLADMKLKVMGRPGIQGAHLNIAAGVGLSIKVRGTDQVVLCFCGNGATNTGSFHEGLNLACTWKVPVIYIVENNFWEVFLHISETTPIEDLAARSASYGIPGVIVDGNDAVAVYETVGQAVKRARAGEGCTLIEAKTYRLHPHTPVDTRSYGGYRSKEEVDAWREKDPVKRLREKLIERGMSTEDELQKMEAKAREEVEAAAKFAMESEYPTKEEILADVYA